MLLMIHDSTQVLVIIVYAFAAASGVGTLSAMRHHAPYRFRDTVMMMGCYVWHLATLRSWDGGSGARIPQVFFFVTVVSTMASISMCALNVEYLSNREGEVLGLWDSLRWLGAHFAAGTASIGFHAVARSTAINRPEVFE